MKTLLSILLFILYVGIEQVNAQCIKTIDDLDDLPSCGLYGDASGASNWNWELPSTDANYCNMWFARTDNGNNLTLMGSPFVDASTSALDQISINEDYRKTKGWELLRRDFGCTHVTAYPYFVLYNKYTGIIRVFVYQPQNQPQYSGVLLQIEPTINPWPATTSLGDELVVAPDKYSNANQAGNFGKMVVAVSEPGGSSRWSITEFAPGFDPNIESVLYSGRGLKFSIFGVMTFDIKATIKGRSVSSTDPKVYNFNYVPATAPTNPGGDDYSFTAQGEKFIKFGKSITEVRGKVNSTATAVINALPNVGILESSLLGKIKAAAYGVRELSLTDEGFGQLLGKASDISQKAGNVLKFVGNMIGLITGIDVNKPKPAPMPTYTSYDLVLNGTITAKSIQQTFILRVPGTQQPNPDNGTYYKCPLGIVNINNTPEADTVKYKRGVSSYFQECCISTSYEDFVSYRMRNNLSVTYNDGVGLDLVSVQAAIVGEVLPDVNGNASYNLLAENVYNQSPPAPHYLITYYNMMRPDLESGRLEVVGYDPEKSLHIFQTPYVDIGCINGQTFNAVARTKVYLRVKAILKKKGDLEETPIIYIKDYKIDVFQGSMDPVLRERHNTRYSNGYLPPYTNYTQLPTFTSKKVLSNVTYSTATTEKADYVVETNNSVIISPNGQNVVFSAGGVVDLKPGFEALTGASFTAELNKYGYAVSCNTPTITAYQYQGSCYNTAISAQSTAGVNPVNDEAPIRVYPTLSKGLVNVSGQNLLNARVTVTDASGRRVKSVINTASDQLMELDLQQLKNGIYFITISSLNKNEVKKVIIQR